MNYFNGTTVLRPSQIREILANSGVEVYDELNELTDDAREALQDLGY